METRNIRNETYQSKILTEAFFLNTKFKDCKFKDCNFNHIDLISTNFSNSQFDDCTFIHSNMRSVVFYESILNDCQFIYSDMCNVIFKLCEMTSPDFSYTSTLGMTLEDTKITDIDWKCFKIDQVELINATFNQTIESRTKRLLADTNGKPLDIPKVRFPNTKIANSAKIRFVDFIGPDGSIGEHVTVCSGVVIDDNVNIGNDTWIGGDTFIGKYTNIANNVNIMNAVVIKNRVLIDHGVTIDSHVLIESDVIIYHDIYIAINVTIKSGCILPNYSIYRANAIIKKGHEGIIFSDVYEYPASCYYDSTTNETIIRLDEQHRTIDEWKHDINSSQLLITPGGQKNWLYVFETLEKYSLKNFKIGEA